MDKRGASIGRVVVAFRVQQECCNAGGRIVVSHVEHKRRSANTGVEAAGGNAAEREPYNCRVGSASAEAKKSVLSFRRSEVGIVSIRRRIDCLRQPARARPAQSSSEQREG